MKRITVLLLALTMGNMAADTQGAWSAVNRGLRARLFTVVGQNAGGEGTYQLYVEFENIPIVSNLGPIEEARTFEYSEIGWKLDVMGPDGKALPHAGPGIFDYMSPGWHLSLPPGGKLSFPVAVGGETAPKSLMAQPSGNPATPVYSPVLPEGSYLHFSPGLGWVIPPTGAYYLSGTFQSPKGFHERGEPRVNWNDTLTLPPVLVPWE